MSNIKINMKEPSIDGEREPLLWESREEDVVERWRSHCIDMNKEHGKIARSTKKKYTIVSIPSILIPVIMSGFSSVLQDYPLVSSGLMVVVSIFTGISGFLNLGAKTQQHFNAEALYGDLALKIETEMCKPKKNRMQCAIYLERIRSEVSKLDLSSPNI
jgi:hypothetical protein